MLQSSSLWSRALCPVEIGEISDEDATKYLESRGAGHNDAMDAVKNVTGGRVTPLTHKASSSESNKEWMERLESNVQVKLITQNIQTLHKAFNLLLSDHGVGMSTLVDNKLSVPDIDYLLKQNIFSLHSNGTYSFQARFVQRFFEKQFKKN
jgi:hypothetical protein